MARSTSQAAYRQVQGLLRGISVLRALNSNTGGRGSVAHLSAATGIHRTTVKRLLETLKDAEVVRYLPDSNEYCLTVNVLQLSEGFRDAVWLSEVARPLMQNLTRKIIWPSDLMILDTDELIVRETTHGITPWSFNSRVLGRHIPILQSAGGHAYFAFCSQEERERLIGMLRSRSGLEGARARSPDYLARLIETTRSRGYALSERGEGLAQRFRSNRCNAIAIPICKDGFAVASLNIVYLDRAISTADVIERLLPDLLAVGQRIEAGIRGPDIDRVAVPLPIHLTDSRSAQKRRIAGGRSSSARIG